jgi:AbrB family looped-hinge helix DNA binding protein
VVLIFYIPYYKVRNNGIERIGMSTATVTSKGQITIPAAVRVALGLDAGSRVEFVEIENGQYAFVAATEAVQSLKGMLRKPDATVSVEQMNQVIEQRGAGQR